MKKFSLVILIAMVSFMVMGLEKQDVLALIPEKVAQIDDKVVGKQEFFDYFLKNMPNGKIPANFNKERADHLFPQLAKNMLTEIIINDAIEAKKVAVSEDELKAFYKQKLQTLSPKDLALIKSRHKNVEQWIEQQSKNSANIRAYRNYKFMKSEFVDKVTVTEEQARGYFNSNITRFKVPESRNIALIVCAFNPKKSESKEVAQKRCSDILERLKKSPESFSAIASKESDCPSKKDGGKVGAVTRNTFAKKLNDAAFALKDGEISPIVEENNSFNIVQCYGINPGRQISYEELRPQIMDMFQRKEAMELLSKFVDSEYKRRKAQVFMMIPEYKDMKFEEKGDAQKTAK